MNVGVDESHGSCTHKYGVRTPKAEFGPQRQSRVQERVIMEGDLGSSLSEMIHKVSLGRNVRRRGRHWVKDGRIARKTNNADGYFGAGGHDLGKRYKRERRNRLYKQPWDVRSRRRSSKVSKRGKARWWSNAKA